jgi:hypothetical protein
MLSPHDRKALLRAFYGLLTLWVINGFTGFIRAAGPGAAIIYIELGLLVGYWIWVFYWWRTNRPKAPRSAAKKPKARQTRETLDAEVRRAVDLEEAVARERNRRRKAQLQRTAGKVGSQVGSGINQLRYVLVGLLVVTIGIFGYQAYDTNRKQEEARIAREAEKTRTTQAMSMWLSRNTCLASKFEQQWQAWYEENPETQTIEIWSAKSRRYMDVTKTLATPQALSEISRFRSSISWGETEIEWRVTRDHFVGLISPIRIECGDQFPPPEGWDYVDIEKSRLHNKMKNFGLVPEGLSYCETDDYFDSFTWQDPFELLNKESNCNLQLIPWSAPSPDRSQG